MRNARLPTVLAEQPMWPMESRYRRQRGDWNKWHRERELQGKEAGKYGHSTVPLAAGARRGRGERECGCARLFQVKGIDTALV